MAKNAQKNKRTKKQNDADLTGMYSRPALERAMKLREWALAGKYPNSVSLAVECDVEPRTIKRDIKFCKERLKWPLVFNSKENGYYFKDPNPTFPPLKLSQADIFALLTAQPVITAYRGTPMEQPLEEAFQRLTMLLNRDVKYSVAGLDQVFSHRAAALAEIDFQAFELLSEGLAKKRAVRFWYRNRGATQWQIRHVEPYECSYVELEHQWYLFAWDLDRNEERTFALVRLREVTVTNEKFKPRPLNFGARLKGSMGAYGGKEDYEVVLEFNAFGADDVRRRRIHASQEIIELPEGALRLRLRLNNLEEITRWVLRFGKDVTVISPTALREKVRNTAREVEAKYKDGTEQGAESRE